MKRIDPTVTAAANKQAETETKANQALGQFKEFSNHDINKPGRATDYRIAADMILYNEKRIPELPNPDEWNALADCLALAGVFEAVADLLGDTKDAWHTAREFQPKKAKNGTPLLGLAFWLYVHGFTNDEGTEARSIKIGDSEPISPADAARFYVDSFPYYNGDPLPVLMATKQANARKALALRNRESNERRGITPHATPTTQNSPQHMPSAEDSEAGELIIMTAQERVDNAILLASEALDRTDRNAASSALAVAYRNGKADVLEAVRQGILRQETADQFIQCTGQLTAAAEQAMTAA